MKGLTHGEDIRKKGGSQGAGGPEGNGASASAAHSSPGGPAGSSEALSSLVHPGGYWEAGRGGGKVEVRWVGALKGQLGQGQASHVQGAHSL